MRIDVTSRSETFRARLSDKLTFADHASFRRLIDEIKAAHAKACILDLEKLDMIDSAGLGMLMITIEESKSSGFSLTLINAHGPVKQLLTLSKIDRLLKVA
jgi:anti-anti-sigma factor